MATKKIIYFIAGNVPTGPEAAAIAKLEAAVGSPYELAIRSNKFTSNYGENRFEAADFVAGTLPAETAANTFYDAVPEINPDAIPGAIVAPATQAVVTHNVDMVVPVTGVYATKIKPTIVDGVITAFVLS